ncbi:hypothetical protein LUX57_30960 [Actinomadura madurae]|uniref:hypothetical protein n=1 Tax=Actinomadura madurae TaxID=1993 RepID=UPI0020D219B1|nr:hypothetical protein [Actinomadura madurae]MCP9969055.1 hypothetical protein [Actinomadura madurae]
MRLVAHRLDRLPAVDRADTVELRAAQQRQRERVPGARHHEITRPRRRRAPPYAPPRAAVGPHLGDEPINRGRHDRHPATAQRGHEGARHELTQIARVGEHQYAVHRPPLSAAHVKAG